MKLLSIAALPVVASFGQAKTFHFLYDKANLKSTQTRFLARQLDAVRKLEACDFFTSLQLNCSLDEFCQILNDGDDVSAYECGGNLETTGEFYYRVEDPLTCYDDFQDENGTIVDPNGSPPQGAAYCSKTLGYFNFTGDRLMSSDLTEEITAPDELKGVLRMVLPISPCTMDESDFFINQPYCIGKCPTVLEINGVECDGDCIECEDGSRLPNCGNIDESLVGDCASPEWEDDDFTQEFLAYFNKSNSATTSSATYTQIYLLFLCIPALFSTLAFY